MTLLNKIFGGINLTWPKLIIFSVIIGAITGIIMMIPALTGTAFQNIGITYEMWFVFPVFIVSNCKKVLEAGFKCFVFFLISQPIVYLIQMPFSDQNLLAMYYYPWFIKTLFTLPGGMIAFLITRKDVIGSIILAVAGFAISCTGLFYLFNYSTDHKVSFVICGLLLLAIAIVFAVVFCPSKKTKTIYLTIVLAASILFNVYYFFSNQQNSIDYQLPKGVEWEETSSKQTNVTYTINEDNVITFVYTKNNPSCEIVLTDEKDSNNTIIIKTCYENGKLIINEEG